MITTVFRILVAAHRRDPNIIRLCRRWKAEDPGDCQKKIDPVSCVRIQGKSALFALFAVFASTVLVFILLRQDFPIPAAATLLMVAYVYYVVYKDLLKNNRWVFDNARQFVFAVWFAEEACNKPFTEWNCDKDEGFSYTKTAIFFQLKLYALEVAKMQDAPFEARKATKMKSVWLWEKTLLLQLFPELPGRDGEYFPSKTELGK